MKKYRLNIKTEHMFSFGLVVNGIDLKIMV